MITEQEAKEFFEKVKGKQIRHTDWDDKYDLGYIIPLKLLDDLRMKVKDYGEDGKYVGTALYDIENINVWEINQFVDNRYII